MRICKKDGNYGTVGFIRAIWKVDEVLECWAMQCDVDAGPTSGALPNQSTGPRPTVKVDCQNGVLSGTLVT